MSDQRREASRPWIESKVKAAVEGVMQAFSPPEAEEIRGPLLYNCRCVLPDVPKPVAWKIENENGYNGFTSSRPVAEEQKKNGATVTPLIAQDYHQGAMNFWREYSKQLRHSLQNYAEQVALLQARQGPDSEKIEALQLRIQQMREGLKIVAEHPNAKFNVAALSPGNLTIAEIVNLLLTVNPGDQSE